MRFSIVSLQILQSDPDNVSIKSLCSVAGIPQMVKQ